VNRYRLKVNTCMECTHLWKIICCFGCRKKYSAYRQISRKGYKKVTKELDLINFVRKNRLFALGLTLNTDKKLTKHIA
jgi:hypothetical protein